MKLGLIFFALMGGVLVLAGCSLLGSAKPTVVISSPPSGSTYNEGDNITIQSTATDSTGVTRVELTVDGAVVRNDTSPALQTNLSLIQNWTATAGSHTLIVRAYNAAGVASDPAAIFIQVTPSIAQNQATPTATLVAVTPAGNTGSVTGQVTLSNGQPAANASIALIDAPAFSTTADSNGRYTLLNVPTGPHTVGASKTQGSSSQVSITVPPGGSVTADLTILIIQTPPTKPAPTPPTCSGTPNIASFTASPNPITDGQSTTLSWGFVSNADSAEIDHGIGGIKTPDSKKVSPSSTTTYTLTAHCGSSKITAQVTVTVNPAVGNFSGHWVTNFGTLDLTQNGANVTGTFHNSIEVGDGTIAGTVAGNTLTGVWQRSVSGNLKFTLGSGEKTFDGNWNGSYQWCGARSGIAFPSGCGFAGTWTSAYDPPNGKTICSMSLTQKDSSVTGTYCNGVIDGGSISFISGYVKLTGTWHFGNINSGPFVFYLPAYTSTQFQGDYNTSIDWCGYRGGTSKPSPCLK